MSDDNLCKMLGGKDLPSIGMALGIERFAELVSIDASSKKIVSFLWFKQEVKYGKKELFDAEETMLINFYKKKKFCWRGTKSNQLLCPQIHKTPCKLFERAPRAAPSARGLLCPFGP